MYNKVLFKCFEVKRTYILGSAFTNRVAVSIVHIEEFMNKFSSAADSYWNKSIRGCEFEL